jgi:spore photoproduct lyase
MKAFAPEIVYVENAAAELPRTRAILEKLPNARIVRVDDHRRIETSAGSNDQDTDRFVRAKKRLAIAVKRGGLVKEFRRHSRLRQAREYYLLHAAGCPYDCSYCYLQAYFENPIPTIFANTEEMFEQVEATLADEKNRGAGKEILFHAGETADALALEHFSGFAAEAVPFFAKIPGALLELRTKSANVESILPLSHSGRTIVSWTLTPHDVAEKYERGAASINERLGAASRCADAGYPIGLRLDPLIHYDGWRSGYRKLIEDVSQSIEPARIHSIALGAFRFPPRLREIMIDRFGRSELILDEFVPSPDGKFRYFRHVREEMYREIVAFIGEFLGEGVAAGIELAMEPEYVWENAGLGAG